MTVIFCAEVQRSEVIAFCALGNRQVLRSNTVKNVFSSTQNRQNSDVFNKVQTNNLKCISKVSVWQYYPIRDLSLFIGCKVCTNCTSLVQKSANTIMTLFCTLFQCVVVPGRLTLYYNLDHNSIE